MMKCFLTSNPIIESSADLNPINGFIDELKKLSPSPAMHFLSVPPPTNLNVPISLHDL